MGELGCPEHNPLQPSLDIVLIPKAQAKFPGRKSDGRGWFWGRGGKRRSRHRPSPPLPSLEPFASRNPSLCPSLAEAGTLYLYFSAPKSGNEEAWSGSAVGWMENQPFQAGFCSVHGKIGRGAVSLSCLAYPMECDVSWGSSIAGGDF